VEDRRPILVTGGHRSGTGWVGQVLASSPRIAYLWEPFSVRHRPGILDAEFPYWFPYVTAENDGHVKPAVADMLAFRYKPMAELRAARAARDLARLARDWSRFRRYRRRGARPLLKDPIAIFSAEWLAGTFDMRVLVLIRHPAAFAYSLKRLGWRHPFDHFLKQPALMKDVLAPFEGEINAFAREERSVLDQAILLWNVIHHAIRRHRERHPEWLFLRLEDIATDPLASFRTICERFGVREWEAVSRAAALTSRSGPAEGNRPWDVRRDSRASAARWRSRLSPEELERIRTGVSSVAADFYADRDWDLERPATASE
jgi:Sulfotransferase family